MEKGSARSKTIKTDNKDRTRRHTGEYTLNDFLSKFELPQFVTILDGHYTENTYGEIELACGQQLTIHAVNKAGTIAAKTCTVKEQDVYLSTDCNQLVELRPNGMKDLLDDRQYSLQEIVRHFQFPLLVQLVGVQRENAVAAELYSEVLRLERVIRDEMVLCSTKQNDETFLHVFPRSLDISVSLGQDPQCMTAEKVINVDKLEKTYEELQLNKIGTYMELNTPIQPYRSPESIAMTNAPQDASSKKAIHSSPCLQTEVKDDNHDLTYEYPDVLRFPGTQNYEQMTSYIFERNSTPTSAQNLGDITEMSIGEVAAFLVSHNLGGFAERFKKEEIDGNMLKDLDEESLKVLGLNAFQAKKLLKLISGWKPKI